jgi:transporter family-2 protein
MSRPSAIIFTALVGALIALQPPANSALAKHVGDVGAAFVSITISLAIITVVLLVAGAPGRLAGLSSFRPEYAVGGIAGAAVVFVSLAAVRPLGAGGVVAILVAGQLVVSVAADRFQWYGLHRVAIGAGRSLGILLVIAGTVLITRS